MPNEKVLLEKQQYVAELKDKLTNAAAGVLVDYKGITVADDTKLRKELREAGVEYRVVKNTMLRLALERGEPPFLILADELEGPHNLGAIIRTAECVGAHGVIVPERRSVGLTPAAVKASAGAVEHVHVARVVNLTRTLEQLQAKNIWTYAVTMDGDDYADNRRGGRGHQPPDPGKMRPQGVPAHEGQD